MPGFRFLWFHPAKDYPPYLGKTLLTCCSQWGAFHFILLLFIQFPRQDCACPSPWSPPPSLLTVLSGAGPNAEESPLPRSPPRASAACDLLWELFKLLPPIMGELRAHPGKHVTSREQPSQRGGDGGSTACFCSTLDTSCTPQRESEQLPDMKASQRILEASSRRAAWEFFLCLMEEKFLLSKSSVGKAALCNDSGVQRTPGSSACFTLDRRDIPMPPAGSLNPLQRLTPLGSHCSV